MQNNEGPYNVTSASPPGGPPYLVRETLIAKPDGLRAVVYQRMLPCGGIAILRDGLS
jgi:hypothetical protein